GADGQRGRAGHALGHVPRVDRQASQQGARVTRTSPFRAPDSRSLPGMKVLFAVDGSEGSFDAVAQVAPLLDSGNDEVPLYCAPPAVKADSADEQVLARARETLLEAVFSKARKRLPDALQGSARTIVGAGDARHGVVAAAEQSGAGLIVL